MSSAPTIARSPIRPPELTWDIAQIFPRQGQWTVSEYLSLNGNYMIEFSEGSLEVMPMPTMLHQLIVLFLYRVLLKFTATQHPGMTLVSPFKVRLAKDKFREPDVLYMAEAHADRMNNDFWDGADLVMEVVSDNDRRRDLETKRLEYAEAGIPEYWIVDPIRQEVIVLTLPTGTEQYAVHGTFTTDQRATSVLLPGFEVAVAEVFAVK